MQNNEFTLAFSKPQEASRVLSLLNPHYHSPHLRYRSSLRYDDRRQLLNVMIICSFSFLPYIANFINPQWFTQRTHYTGNMTPLCFLRYPSPCHVPLPYPTFLHLLIYFTIVPYPNIIRDLVSLSTVLEHFYSLTLILVWIIMIAFLHFSFTLLYSFFSTML